MRKEKGGQLQNLDWTSKYVYICVLNLFLGLKWSVCRVYFFVDIFKKRKAHLKKKQKKRERKNTVY